MPKPKDPARILVVDDQRFDRHRLARLCSGLPRAVEVSNADCLGALEELLDTQSFDLILLDYCLPDGTGLDALRKVQMCPRNCTAATIMVAGERREDIAAEALATGCADYIAKDDLTPERFRVGIARALDAEMPLGDLAQASSDVARALAAFSTECARELKPQVSRVLRQLRELRSAADPAKQAEARDGIERSCMRLWETLVELEKYEASDLELDPRAAAPRTTSGQPSVFGRPS